MWIGNFAGALFVVFLIYMAAIYKLNGEAVANTMVSVAAGKVAIDAVTIFFRGILCNIFVCLAVWIGTAGKTCRQGRGHFAAHRCLCGLRF